MRLSSKVMDAVRGVSVGAAMIAASGCGASTQPVAEKPTEIVVANPPEEQPVEIFTPDEVTPDYPDYAAACGRG